MADATPSLPNEGSPVETTAVGVDQHPASIHSCLCRLGGELFAVDIRCVREVIVAEHHASVPGAPPDVLGVLNVRGKIVPWVDIGPVLGLPPRGPGPGRDALIVEAGVGEMAIAVHEILGIESLSETAPSQDAVVGTDAVRSKRLEREGSVVSLLDISAVADALRSRWRASAGVRETREAVRVAQVAGQEEAG
jgi:purine-binding chemotaxis protein CheW